MPAATTTTASPPCATTVSSYNTDEESASTPIQRVAEDVYKTSCDVISRWRGDDIYRRGSSRTS